MNEFPRDEFDHDRIVDEPETGNLVGNQIVRIDEVGEGIDDSPAIGPFEAPLQVGHHGDQLFENSDPLEHEVGCTNVDRLLREGCGAMDHGRLAPRAVARTHLLEPFFEKAQILVTGFEGNPPSDAPSSSGSDQIQSEVQ